MYTGPGSVALIHLIALEWSRCEQLVDCACVVLLVCAVSLCSLGPGSHSLHLTISPPAEPSGQTTPSTAGGSVAHLVTQSTPPLPGECVCVGGGGELYLCVACCLPLSLHIVQSIAPWNTVLHCLGGCVLLKLIGASLSEPHLVRTTLSIYIYIYIYIYNLTYVIP